jgi:hypothetical protein
MQKLSDRMMEIIVKGRKGGSGRRYRIGYIASPVT